MTQTNVTTNKEKMGEVGMKKGFKNMKQKVVTVAAGTMAMMSRSEERRVGKEC